MGFFPTVKHSDLGNFSPMNFWENGKNHIMSNLGENLQKWMKIRKLNRKALALKASLNETYIRDILDGRSINPQARKLAQLCGALEIYPNELIPEIAALYPQEVLEDLQEYAEIREKRRAREQKIKNLKET